MHKGELLKEVKHLRKTKYDNKVFSDLLGSIPEVTSFEKHEHEYSKSKILYHIVYKGNKVTLTLSINNKGIIRDLYVENGFLEKPTNFLGCGIGLIIGGIIMIWILFKIIAFFIGDINDVDSDTYDTDTYYNENESDNFDDSVKRIQEEIEQEEKYGDDYSDKH